MRFNKIRSLNLLIKPVSCDCNLRCSYCFYFDEAKNRKIYSYGNMQFETLENLVKNAFSHVEYEVSFMFQGGEPTLRGINYFYKLHEYVEKYNVNKIKVNFSIQTNGTMLNKRWFDLFEKYKYLIGISIDGTKDIHDIFRIDIRKRGTFDSILNNINELKRRQIDFNILCVVNKLVAKNAKKIYEYFKLQDFYFLQFIPMLDSLKDAKKNDYSLSDKDYGYFLDELFNLWYQDIKKGNIVNIRYFENLLLILLGKSPESCDMVGQCSVNFVVESDGGVYPCDFYVLDEYKIGDINKESIVDIVFSKKAMDFVRASLKKPRKCIECKYIRICRTGCKRHKNDSNENKFCYSFTYFLDKNLSKLEKIRDMLLENRN